MKKIIFMVLAVTALSGCSKLEQISEDDSTGVPVKLYGAITDVTRGDGVITGKPALDFDVFRVDKRALFSEGAATGSYEYPATYADKIGGSMTVTSGAITLTPTQSYSPVVGIYTKFIGVYPKNGVYSSAGRTVTYASLDGTTDVMISNIAEGNNETEDIVLTFSHLLTRIEVKVKAKFSVAADSKQKQAAELINIKTAWGNITHIAVRNKKTGVVVTLPHPSSSAAPIPYATGAPADLPLTNKLNGDPVPTPGDPLVLTGEVQEFGYAMFVPSTTGENLTLEVKTDGSFAAGINAVTTKSLTYAAGTSYTITLLFSIGDGSAPALEAEVTAGTGNAGDWTPAGSEGNDEIEV
jgi:hypothetical protein